jgi:hypothetical protein
MPTITCVRPHQTRPIVVHHARIAEVGATYIATGDKRIYICGTSNARNPNESRSRDFYCPQQRDAWLAWGACEGGALN